MSQDVVHWPLIDQPSIEGSGIDVAEAHSNHATPWKTSCGFLVASGPFACCQLCVCFWGKYGNLTGGLQPPKGSFVECPFEVNDLTCNLTGARLGEHCRHVGQGIRLRGLLNIRIMGYCGCTKSCH